MRVPNHPAGSCSDPGAGERGAGGCAAVVGDAELASTVALQRGIEGDIERATGSGGERTTAGVGGDGEVGGLPSDGEASEI